MGTKSDKNQRKKYLILSLLSNLTVLIVFKYLGFINETFRQIFEYFQFLYPVPIYNILLPVGISFYTFQVVGYSIDVYRGDIKPCRNFTKFSLFVTFFPQLIAGPIERASRLIPQIEKKTHFNYRNVSNGLKLIVWGLFKKVVIADRLAIAVDTVYSNPTGGFDGIHFIIATLFFAFQIYCDFSGYVDIAIGSAQMLGISLMENFNRPYQAKNIQEFWRRWHISLSEWFRDYVYIPMGGSRVSSYRLHLNILITFILCGIWHGANWTFVIWGCIHGLYLILYVATRRLRNKLSCALGLNQMRRFSDVISISITFISVSFAWIFFRAETIDDAYYIITHLFTGIPLFIYGLSVNFLFNLELAFSGVLIPAIKKVGLSNYDFMLIVLSIILLETVHLIQRHDRMRHLLINYPVWFRSLVYYTLVISIIIFGVFTKEEFIYFQF